MVGRSGLQITWLALFGVLGLAVLGGAAPAGAAGSTLNYYNVNQSIRATDPAGHPLANGGSGAAPTPGDHLDYTALNYSGNHKRHASMYAASSHLACTFMTATTLTCDAQFAIGGSLLLGNRVAATLASDGTSSIPINTGTGKYKNAMGTITVAPIKNSVNADVTIRLKA